MDRQLPYGQAYPKRPPFFFAHAIRVMSHYAVAREVGLLGYAILMEVVATEDKRDYTSAPTFWQCSFYDRFNRGKDAVSEAIQKCVEAGWLHWDQPANRRLATAWLVIPAYVNQAVVKRDWAGFPPNHPTEYPPNHPTEYPPNYPAKHPASSSPAHTQPAPTPEWTAAEAAVRLAGVSNWRRSVSDCRKHGLQPSDVLDLVAWWQDHQSEFSRPEGALCYALRNAHPSQREDWGLAFPRKPEAVQRPLAAQGTQSASTADDHLRAREGRLRQMEFQWEAEVKGLTIPEIVTKFELPAELQTKLARYPTWEHTRNADSLRIEVLTHVAKRLAS